MLRLKRLKPTRPQRDRLQKAVWDEVSSMARADALEAQLCGRLKQQ